VRFLAADVRSFLVNEFFMSHKRTTLSVLCSVALLAGVAPNSGAAALEDWPAASAKVLAPAEWRPWLDWRKTQLARWMQDGREWLGEPVGWMHDYVDPSGQATLGWKPYSPLPPVSQARSRAAWVAHNRAHNIRQLVEAGRMFRLTGESRYADWARSQLLAYAEAYARLPLQTWGGQARLMTQTLDEATCLIDILESIRLIKPALSTGDQALITQKLVSPILANFKRSPFGGNIGIWQASATYVAGLYLEDKLLEAEGLDGPHGILTLLKKFVTPDGFWFESSLGYQSYVVRAIHPSIVAADLYDKELAAVQLKTYSKGLIQSAMSLRLGPKQLPNPSDSIGTPELLGQQFYLDIIRSINTDLGALQTMKAKNWDVLLRSPQAPVELSLQDPPTGSTHYPISRFAHLVHQGWTAFFKYGDKSGGHAHDDKFNVELTYKGRRLMSDPGTVAYGNPAHEAYYKRPQAHNTVTVDGKPALAWGGERTDDAGLAMGQMCAADARFAPDLEVERCVKAADGLFTQTTRFKPTKAAATPKTYTSFLTLDCALKDSAAMASTGSLRAMGSFKTMLQCSDAVVEMTVTSAPSADILLQDSGNLPYARSGRLAIKVEQRTTSARHQFDFRVLALTAD
jgi:oligo-alginate lyase